MFEHVHTEIVTSDTSSVSMSGGLSEGVISSLNGNRDDEYLVRFWWKSATAPTRSELVLRLNGVTTASALGSNIFYSINGTVTRINEANRLSLFIDTTYHYLVGEINIWASVSPGDVAMTRPTYFRSVLCNEPVNGSGDVGAIVGSAVWDNSVDNLVSIGFDTLDQPGTSPAVAIAQGSVFEIWRKVQQ